MRYSIKLRHDFEDPRSKQLLKAGQEYTVPSDVPANVAERLLKNGRAVKTLPKRETKVKKPVEQKNESSAA